MSAAGDDSVLVVKFGGTSLLTAARVRRAAARVARLVASGRRVVVVVSAMGHTTDRILGTLAAVSGGTRAEACRREADRALATGEDLSAALLAAALNARGVPSRSLRGGEAGVRTRGAFGSARVARVETRRLRTLLSGGVVPVVSGFQGERPDRETATLGRGGSDTSAVAIAAALGSVPCHIVTDVDAVYERDPRSHPSARRLPVLTHRALVALAREGAKVVHPEAARIARRRGVPLRVLSFASRPEDEQAGTYVGRRP